MLSKIRVKSLPRIIAGPVSYMCGQGFMNSIRINIHDLFQRLQVFDGLYSSLANSGAIVLAEKEDCAYHLALLYAHLTTQTHAALADLRDAYKKLIQSLKSTGKLSPEVNNRLIFWLTTSAKSYHSMGSSHTMKAESRKRGLFTLELKLFTSCFFPPIIWKSYATM